jgi:hypothetical protein
MPEFAMCCGVVVSLPLKPPTKEFVNYGLKKHEQKFRRREIPKGIIRWDVDKLEAYAKREWHIRLNGYWILINGNQHYIPGGADVFFNYWTTEQGKRPTFRMEALEFFLVWYLEVERNPNVQGMVDIKCRRLGDTEKGLFLNWETLTRTKYTRTGMQHLNDADAQKNFIRMVTGALNMPFFYKPIHKGAEKPSKELDYSEPSELVTKKKLKEKGDNVDLTKRSGDFLNSFADYQPSVTMKYDGQLLHFFHLDEAFKNRSFRLDPKAQWSNIRRCTSLNNGELIVGKGLYTSTVEEIDDGNMVEVATYFWDNSQQSLLKTQRRTNTNMIAVFRGFQYAAEIDEFGYHKVEEATKLRQAKIDVAMASGDIREVLSIKRKEPANIEEALETPLNDCVLYPELCGRRINQIRRNHNWFDEPQKAKMVVGRLEWMNNIQFSRVVFVPDVNGKWNIVRQPGVLANNISRKDNKLKPLNGAYFRIGIDPYDADETEEKGSDGGIAVRMLFCPELEKEEVMYDENGEVANPEVLETDQFIADYKDRPANPYVFYEECAKACFYFGSSALVETDKAGMKTWFNNKGLKLFLQFAPSEVSETQSKRRGMKATTSVVSRYTEALACHIPLRIACTHLPRLLEQWKVFSIKKRGKLDLAVASGFAELGTMGLTYKQGSQNKGSWSTSNIYGT